ncbi:MAG: ABC transporter permease [Clostridia bacterium]
MLSSGSVEQTVKKQSAFKEVFRRLCKNKSAIVALCVILLFLLIAIFSGVIAPYEQVIKQNYKERLLSPDLGHLFGTDDFGRDMFMRVIYGTRISLFIGVLVAAASLVVGGCFGALCAYYGGLVDGVIMRFMDMLTSLPSILLSMCVVAALGASLQNLLIALTISQIPIFTRMVRSSMLTVVDMEYVEAAKACGTRDGRIMLKHILPNAMGPVIIQTTRTISQTILSAAGLSYIGLGVQPPTPEWGSMLSSGREYMYNKPWLMIFPGIALVITSLSFELLGDGLRDALDPRLKD